MLFELKKKFQKTQVIILIGIESEIISLLRKKKVKDADAVAVTATTDLKNLKVNVVVEKRLENNWYSFFLGDL